MADNVLAATIEAIAESDNEIGGTLITRLKESHISGRNDGSVAIGGDILTSPEDVFTAAMVDLEIDIIINPAGSTGNEGRYLISSFLTSKTVQLTDLAGSSISFAANEDPVIWRIGSLRVETVYEFLSPPTATDLVGKLWVGDEPNIVTYGAIVMVPGGNSFEQLGNPLTGLGYLTKTQNAQSEVIEARKGYSALDKLRRSFLIDYATEEEIDRIGRNNQVPRPRGMADDMYRSLIKVMSYLSRGIIYAFELVLQVLYPAKTPSEIREMIYEDLVNYPASLFILLPEVAPSANIEGKFLLDTKETAIPTTTTEIAAGAVPIKVASVTLTPVADRQEMNELPSAVGWTYQNEGDTEANVFSITPWYFLKQQISSLSTNGGRYEWPNDGIGKDYCDMSIWWSPVTLSTIGGYPWHIMFHDGEREYCLFWKDTECALGKMDGTLISSAATLNLGAIGKWYLFRLVRQGDYIYGYVNGQDLWGAIAANLFPASVLKKAGFGYINNASNNQWEVYWDQLSITSKSKRNYYNINRADGVLSSSSDVLTSASGLFITGDANKLFRCYSLTESKNNGIWLARYFSATEVILYALMLPEASVSGSGTSALVELLDPYFRSVDVTKTLVISGSALGNDGDVVILEVIDAYTARVNKPGGFISEQHLNWGFQPVFASESNVPWELIEAGSTGYSTITLRDALPSSTIFVDLAYTTVLGGQIVRNEFIVNNGSGGTVPNIYYPGYFLDASLEIRKLLDDIKAGGITLVYQRIN